MTITVDAVKQQLVSGGLPQELVDELIKAFSEARRNHYLGGHRLTAVEGGRFCEAAYRVLEHMTYKSFTPLGTHINIDELSRRLANEPAVSVKDSVRLHMPRTMRVIYDIRNRRDAVHLCDGIDPNIQDSSLIIACINWVTAELVRLHHNIDANSAADLIKGLVERTVPVIQSFDGVPRVLRDLSAGDTCLLLLYQYAPDSMTLDDLRATIRPRMRQNLPRTLQRLDDRSYVHMANGKIWITHRGERHVEQHGLTDDL